MFATSVKWRFRFYMTTTKKNDNLTWICDGQCAYTEVLSTGSSQLNVVTIVVVDSGLSQHGVVLDLALPAKRKWFHV